MWKLLNPFVEFEALVVAPGAETVNQRLLKWLDVGLQGVGFFAIIGGFFGGIVTAAIFAPAVPSLLIQTGGLASVSAIVALFICAPGFIGSMGLGELVLAALAVGVLSFGVGSVLGTAAADFLHDPYRLERLAELLSPLAATPTKCSHALQVMRHPEAAAYRDRVLAQGRELLLVDFYALMNIAAGYEEREAEERGREACRMLQGAGALA